MGARTIDPERDRLPDLAGLPVLDRLESNGGPPAASGAAADSAGNGLTNERPIDGELSLPFDARSRSRLRAKLSSGQELALVLPRGSVLRDGAIVSGSGWRIRVRAGDEDVLEVYASTATALARAAYHLGNRHVPVQVCPDRLILGYDSVLADMLVGLGASLRRSWAPFEPEGGAYAHGH